MKNSTSMVIRSAFLRLLPAEMISIVVSAVNALVDSIVTGHFLGTGAMAAIGLFSPVTTFICLSFVIASGMQILCGRHIGSGEKDQVVSLFSTGMAVLGMYALILTASLLLFHGGLSAVLGARGETAQLLSDYMTGYSFGIIGQVFSSTLMIFLPYNKNCLRRIFLEAAGSFFAKMQDCRSCIVCISERRRNPDDCSLGPGLHHGRSIRTDGSGIPDAAETDVLYVPA